VPGLGPRELGEYDRCHSCQQGTWQRYGGLPLCKHHALQAAASQGGPKTCAVPSESGKEGQGDTNHEIGEQTHG
jgi:hypothetical protein